MIKRMNKQGGLTDLFVFMIISFVLVLMCGVLIYVFNEAKTEVRENIADMDLVGDGMQNATDTFDDTFGSAVTSFNALYWITGFLMFGMIIAIFIGSYLVTTKPVFFIPYIFIVIIAVVCAVPISNAYERIYNNAILNATMSNMVSGSFILAQLPIIVAIVGIAGGIIMFVRMGKREEASYYGY